MTMTELLHHMAAGNFKVQVKHPLMHATSDIGIVQEIKIFGEKNVGCGVNFPGTNWNTWFHQSDETDKRKRYMRDLQPIIE